MIQNSSLDLVTQAVLSFVHARTWGDSKQIVEEQQELLLTDEADDLFANLLIQYADDADVTRMIEGHRALLRRCREEGIEAAFADLMPPNALLPLLDALVACDSPAAVYELAAQHPELLSDELDARIQEGIADARIQGSEQSKAYAQHVEERYQTVRQLRQMARPHPNPLLIPRSSGHALGEGEKAVRTGQESPSQAQESFDQQVFEAVQTFVYPATATEKRRIVEQERDLLLTDAALEVFAAFLELYKEDAGAIRTLIDHRDLLIRCRKEGIEAAFADLMPPNAETNALLPLLDALITCNSSLTILELAAQQPTLLSDEMDAFLQQHIAAARAGTDEGKAYAQHVEKRHQTLRQLRQMMD